ncbi:MAG: hypothetical protein CMD27_00310 [Flavobacteriales bacterium]|nr:hypothetical protein [Flavobacteriales bacterium]
MKKAILILCVFIGCENIETGCIYPDACNYNSDALEDDGSCEYESCAGCLDTNACNYNPASIIENNTTCVYPEPWFDCNGISILNQYVGEWLFTRISGYSNPYESGSNEITYTGIISLGTNFNKLYISTNQYSNGELLLEEFLVNENGEIEDFQYIYYYNFNGYFTGDSLVYLTGANGSPFQQSYFTCYGQKIN